LPSRFTHNIGRLSYEETGGITAKIPVSPERIKVVCRKINKKEILPILFFITN